MIVWVDAHLSPRIARLLSSQFAIQAVPVRDLGLREATDQQIFEAARAAKAVVMTKDADFVDLVERQGPPPQILWVTSGNTSEERLRKILGSLFQEALNMLEAGEPLVEVSGSAVA